MRSRLGCVWLGFSSGVVLAVSCGGDDSGGSKGGAGTGGVAGGVGGAGTGGTAGIDGSAGSGGTTGGSAGATSIDAELEAQGFTVQPGSFRVLDLADCCQPGKNCSGNNPASPYAAFYAPRAPGQTAANPGEGSDGLSPSVRLRADEALIWVGQSPPVAKYFGFTPYLMDKQDSGGLRKPVFASLSETTNNLVIQTGGATPFSSPVAIVATADAATESKAKSALTKSGVAPGAINTIVFDPALAKLGVADADDTVGVLFRVALFESPAQGKAWLDAVPGALLRATPKTPAPPSPLPSPASRKKDLSTTESSLAPALDALEAAVIAKYSSFTSKTLFITKGEPNPVGCIQNLTFCGGDNRDANYPSTLPQVLFATPNEFYVVIGVDHTKTAKTTYSSFSIYAVDHLVGVASVTSDQWEGSALDYLPNHPDAHKLYAWKVARNCGTDVHCLAIPDAGCPTGVGAGKPGTITFRTYLEPSTATAPDPSTLVIDRVIKFE